MAKALELEGLPGAELVRSGIDDWAAGKWTPEALLVSIASARLRSLGLELPEPAARMPQHPELELYGLLVRSHWDDPYYRYNALLKELDSFLEAASVRRRHRA